MLTPEPGDTRSSTSFADLRTEAQARLQGLPPQRYYPILSTLFLADAKTGTWAYEYQLPSTYVCISGIYLHGQASWLSAYKAVSRGIKPNSLYTVHLVGPSLDCTTGHKCTMPISTSTGKKTLSVGLMSLATKSLVASRFSYKDGWRRYWRSNLTETEIIKSGHESLIFDVDTTNQRSPRKSGPRHSPQCSRTQILE